MPGLLFLQCFTYKLGKKESKRADSNRLSLLITSDYSGVAGVAGPCKTRISKQLSLHRFAGCCTVLCSRWCQSGINSIYLLNSRYCASLQVVLQDAGCRLRRGTEHFYRNASASSHI